MSCGTITYVIVSLHHSPSITGIVSKDIKNSTLAKYWALYSILFSVDQITEKETD